MSKFDVIFESEDSSEVELSAIEAAVAIASIAAGIDAALAESDPAPVVKEFFAGVLQGIAKSVESFDPEATQEKIVTAIEEGSLGGLYNAAYEALSDELTPYAYGLSALAIAVDGQVPEGATDFLNELQASLELSDEEAKAAFEELVAAAQ